MDRLSKIVDAGDPAALDAYLRQCARGNDVTTGRELLARFDRYGVAAHLDTLPLRYGVPRSLAPIIYRGIHLAWDHRTAVLFAADCAERVLSIFEAACPGDDRPRRAIEAARAWTRCDVENPNGAAAYGADAASINATNTAYDAANAAAYAANTAANTANAAKAAAYAAANAAAYAANTAANTANAAKAAAYAAANAAAYAANTAAYAAANAAYAAANTSANTAKAAAYDAAKAAAYAAGAAAYTATNTGGNVAYGVAYAADAVAYTAYTADATSAAYFVARATERSRQRERLVDYLVGGE